MEIRKDSSLKPSKPGPKPQKCKWCQKVQCNHCQCPGYARCDHSNGEPCVRHRYKRRLVCNTCEKSKLRDESTKKLRNKLLGREKHALARKLQHVEKSQTRPVDYKSFSSLDTLCAIVSSEARRVPPLPDVTECTGKTIYCPTLSEKTFHSCLVPVESTNPIPIADQAIPSQREKFILPYPQTDFAPSMNPIQSVSLNRYRQVCFMPSCQTPTVDCSHH